MHKTGKAAMVTRVAAKKPAAKKETAAQKTAAHTRAVKAARSESAKTRHLAAAKAAKTRARNKAAKAKAAALDPGGRFDGCVITAVACRLALAGRRPPLGALMTAFTAAGGRAEGGVAIEGMLAALGETAVLAGYRRIDIDADALDEPGLILGADLPGPHAVVTVPAGALLTGAGALRVPLMSSVTRQSRHALSALSAPPAHWLSWGTQWDPAAEFPAATVTEAWRIW